MPKFLRDLRAAYPGRSLVLVWDNWPAHARAAVLAEAPRQRMHQLWLPTAASWEHPIEQVWRWTKHEPRQHHRLADRWQDLNDWGTALLDQFATGSPKRLLSVGRCPRYLVHAHEPAEYDLDGDEMTSGIWGLGRGELAYWRLFYHVVWATHDREPMVLNDVETIVESSCIRCAKRRVICR